MGRIILIGSALVIIAIGSPAALAQGFAPAPDTPGEQKPRPAPKREHSTHASVGAEPESQAEPVSLKLARGGKVSLNNRAGEIVITGWDRDTVEATATSDEGPHAVKVQVDGEAPYSRVVLSPSPVARGRREIRLDVKLPRHAELEPIEMTHGDIRISDVDSAIGVSTGHGNVSISHVRSAEVSRRHGNINITDVKGDVIARSLNGEVNVEKVDGLVDLAATNGSIMVRDAAGDVRAVSATGEIGIHCVKGRADVSTATGDISLFAIGGDIEAMTANGEVIYEGNIRSGRSYRLKTLSGAVSMSIQHDPPGFTAVLTTYDGEINTDFPLKVDSPLTGSPVNRRVTGRYGDGKAQIMLDSFSGAVSISKAKPGTPKVCK